MVRIPGPGDIDAPAPRRDPGVSREIAGADAFGAIEGRLLEARGEALESIGDAVGAWARERLQEQQDAMDSSFLIAFDAFERQNAERSLTEAVDAAEGPASGLFETVTNNWAEGSADRLDTFLSENNFTPSDRALRQAQNIQVERRGSLGIGAIRAQTQAARTFHQANLATSLQSVATSIVSNPSGYQEALEAGRNMINQASAFLPAAAISEQRAAWGNQAAWAWAQGMIVGGRADEVLRGTGLGAATPRPVERPEGAPTASAIIEIPAGLPDWVMSHAEAMMGWGLNSQVTIIFADLESGFQNIPTGVPLRDDEGNIVLDENGEPVPGSDAHGPWQFTSRTWAGVMRNFPELGLTVEGRFDEYQQALAAAALAKEAVETLEAFVDRPLNGLDLYLAWFAGARNAGRMLAAGNDTLARNIIPVSWLTTHELGADATVGDVLTALDRNRGLDQMPVYIDQVPSPILTDERAATIRGGDHQILSNLTPQQMVQAHRAAEQFERDRIARLRADVQGELENELTMLSAGQTPPSPLARTRIMEAYGAEDGLEVWEQLQEMRAVGSHIAGFSLLPWSDVQAQVRSYRPQPGDDFIEQTERFRIIQRAAELEREARQDPAQYAFQRSPEARQAAEAIDPLVPETMRNAMAVSLTVQAEMGIPEHLRRPMTGEVASQFVLAWENPENDAGQKIDMLAGITVALNDDRLGRQVIDQLVEAGIAGGNEDIIYVAEVARDPVRRQSAIAVLQAVLAGDTPVLSSAQRADLNRAFGTAWDDSVGQVHWQHGRLTGEAGSLQRAERERLLLMRLSELGVVSGENQTQAVAQAHLHLYGGEQGHVEDGFGAIVIPPHTDKNSVVRGLEYLRRNIPVTPEGLVSRIGLEGDRLALGQAEAAIEDWGDRAVWVNHEDGYALVDPTTGALITTDDGEIWTVSVQQTLDAFQQTLDAWEEMWAAVAEAARNPFNIQFSDPRTEE